MFGYEFANPEYFWLLLVLIPMIIWYIFKEKRSHADLKFSSIRVFKQMKRGSRIWLRHLLFAARVLAILFLVLALARPQSSTSWQTYNSEGIVCERDQDVWANKECFTTKLPMLHVDDLASYVDYPICKMLITLDPARRDAVCAAGKEQFAGRIDLYPSSPFFIEAVPLGVAKDRSLAALLERMGLTRENLMACGDGLNDRSMISYAGVGVAMQNAEDAVKAVADYVTAADNNHDGVAEAIEKFILN